ncbi:hypothetical protein [Leucothrix pacifica]|uniref:Sulfur reduction protein DsrS n=1 Tax=Leucothrix pacifica TaxID=1247513 RepID=A0A317CIY7_9GAMM|nr:hypothetical protein [Leucothrix pacifica]PWQ98151.1 hypothetical protein DKW60_08535 [Leucothrix pacifica]
MELCNEDNLRLNVLLAQPLRAIRINENTLTVVGLTERGEATVQLNPTVRDEQYLRWVRELLALKATGSPAGYPVFMKRWTRIGQIKNNLKQMLLLGEPEAIVAVSHAPDMTLDIAECAWWANPSTEVAMGLLQYAEVYESDLGKALAAHLMEFLPFEESPVNIVYMVRACLQGELLDETQRLSLWRRAKRRHPFYVGFTFAEARQIPLDATDSPTYETLTALLATQLAEGNAFAKVFAYQLSAAGQAWLQLLALALKKPVDPDVVVALFHAVDQRFDCPAKPDRGVRDINDIDIDAVSAEYPELAELRDTINESQQTLLEAGLLLAMVGEHTLNPIFGGNDSVGTVMRKRLAPLTEPLLEKIDILTNH